MNTTYDVWTDPDLGDLVRREPKLAAIADALAQADAHALLRRRTLHLRGSLRIGALAAALAAAVAVALIAPWNREGGSLSDLALAAVGSQSVLHVIAETPTGNQLINIQTGAIQPVMQQHEIWYDADEGLKHTLTRSGQTLLDDELDTPQGGYVPGGIVYDCAWIAAHPVAATKARVSCNASGQNGTTPRTIPRPKPTLEPGIAGFVDGYQQALASGQARDSGSGQVDGQPVDWLLFQTSSGSEKVALDQTTHKPILLEADHGFSLQITTIETIPYDPTDFARPRADELPARPSRGGASDLQALDLDGPAIAAAIPGAAWAGATVAGLPLVRAEQQTLTSSFAHHSQPPQTGTGLELVYGALAANGRLDRSQPYVQISEAPSAILAFGNMWGFIHSEAPPAGQFYQPIPHSSVAHLADGSTVVNPPSYMGFTVHDGSYVTIEASSQDILLQGARALQPVTP